ncbi:Protein-L-isoaspartate carboxylmethyltransferase [Candidatus Terasakiella magnetica]|nr:Protein-L-isoaspartate carboxylmethyltransferase [Candidatus Terasakiella magnetica]
MDFAAARHMMVENQIRTNGVHATLVAKAISTTPREVFLAKAMRGFAYVDEDLPIGGGRFMIEPLVLARLLQAADVKASDVVLTIGDASGWGAAVLSRLASTVVALEQDGEFIARAAAALSELGVDNVALVQGDLTEGYPAQAPYDVIVFAGAVADIPQGIARQLADGGRLVAVVNEGAGMGKGGLTARVGDSFGRRVMFDAGTAYLPGFKPAPGFVF